jgi:hypothetical protein
MAQFPRVRFPAGGRIPLKTGLHHLGLCSQQRWPHGRLYLYVRDRTDNQKRRCYTVIMAQTPSRKTEGYADLLLKIEHCRRLATEVPDLRTAQQLLELATEYLKQLMKTEAQ